MEYQVLRSSRKTIAIQVKPDGAVVVRCPRRMPMWQIRAFVQSKADWIAKHTAGAMPVEPRFTQTQMEQLREQTRALVTQRVSHFAPLVGVSYSRIAIRIQHTRWGSCSSKGNLNFNCLLALVPEPVLDYVVVHELCHRKQMDHSDWFWAEVEAVLPDYVSSKRWLRDHGGRFLARLPSEEG